MKHTVFHVNCPKCNFIGPAKVVKGGPHLGLYCTKCSQWIKWASKEEGFALVDEGSLEVEENATMLEPIVGNSNRAKEWIDFSRIVLDHVDNYTIPQWGDYPDDQLTEFTPEEIIMNLKRYVNRGSTNMRGPEEALRDCLKIAHYAGVRYFKLLDQFATSENRTQEDDEDA